MKKILSYILLTITILSSQSIAFAYENYENPAAHNPAQEQILIASDNNKDYRPPVIPKPEYIPGPEIDLNSENPEAGRKALVDTVLPKFAIGTISLIGGLAVLFIVIGGVRFVASYGNDELVESAKKQVIYSIVGLFLALLAYTIVTIVANLQFKQDQTNRSTPTENPDNTSAIIQMIS